MTLSKKIMLGFLVSSFIIMILAVTAYLSFIEVRREIRHLEISDSIRSRVLQLRRHEKNFLLYGNTEELNQFYINMEYLNDIIDTAMSNYRNAALSDLSIKISDYREQFNLIGSAYSNFLVEFNSLKEKNNKHASFFPLIEATVLERPLVNADLIERLFYIPKGNNVLKALHNLSMDLSAVRKYGEEIVILSKGLDKSARDEVEQALRYGEISLFLLSPLFFFVGLGILFYVSRNAVKRLNVLAYAIGKAGKGEFLTLPVTKSGDEVSMLMDAFNRMKQDLVERDEELFRKNEELHRSRKLASIGTLAAGVAHEINNPLNNIYLAAQTLQKETTDGGEEIIKDSVNDIFSQTLRVKRIVSDLLIFAKEKPPDLKKVNIGELIIGVIGLMKPSSEFQRIEFKVDLPDDLEILADRYLIEQVFVNLFGNAAYAMSGQGSISVTVDTVGDSARIMVSDTGGGICPADISRIFDPFYTTKDKGTGLGLAIVHGIIEKHYGNVEVESVPGKGTSFRIILPKQL